MKEWKRLYYATGKEYVDVKAYIFWVLLLSLSVTILINVILS